MHTALVRSLKKSNVSYELEINGAFLSENVLTFPQMQYSGVIWYRKN